MEISSYEVKSMNLLEIPIVAKRVNELLKSIEIRIERYEQIMSESMNPADGTNFTIEPAIKERLLKQFGQERGKNLRFLNKALDLFRFYKDPDSDEDVIELDNTYFQEFRLQILPIVTADAEYLFDYLSSLEIDENNTGGINATQKDFLLDILEGFLNIEDEYQKFLKYLEYYELFINDQNSEINAAKDEEADKIFIRSKLSSDEGVRESPEIITLSAAKDIISAIFKFGRKPSSANESAKIKPLTDPFRGTVFLDNYFDNPKIGLKIASQVNDLMKFQISDSRESGIAGSLIDKQVIENQVRRKYLKQYLLNEIKTISESSEYANYKFYEITFKRVRSGYSDITIKLVDKDDPACIIEIQFNSHDTLTAKELETKRKHERDKIETDLKVLCEKHFGTNGTSAGQRSEMLLNGFENYSVKLSQSFVSDGDKFVNIKHKVNELHKRYIHSLVLSQRIYTEIKTSLFQTKEDGMAILSDEDLPDRVKRDLASNQKSDSKTLIEYSVESLTPEQADKFNVPTKKNSYLVVYRINENQEIEILAGVDKKSTKLERKGDRVGYRLPGGSIADEENPIEGLIRRLVEKLNNRSLLLLMDLPQNIENEQRKNMYCVNEDGVAETKLNYITKFFRSRNINIEGTSGYQSINFIIEKNNPLHERVDRLSGLRSELGSANLAHVLNIFNIFNLNKVSSSNPNVRMIDKDTADLREIYAGFVRVEKENSINIFPNQDVSAVSNYRWVGLNDFIKHSSHASYVLPIIKDLPDDILKRQSMDSELTSVLPFDKIPTTSLF
jgi:hypothetical protein